MQTREKTKRLTGLALFTALVVVLQMLGSFIHLGTFSVSMVLVPIAVGAALFGPAGGAWLGFVFGLAVLMSGDAAFFMSFNFIGTVITVLLKGALAGWAAGLIYRAAAGKPGTADDRTDKSSVIGAFLAALTAPVVNTGVFVLGTILFFIPLISQIAGDMNVYKYIFVGLIGGNFFFELALNLILVPVIERLIRIQSRM